MRIVKELNCDFVLAFQFPLVFFFQKGTCTPDLNESLVLLLRVIGSHLVNVFG